MFNRTTLAASFLLVVTSLAQAQSRCELIFRGPRDVPACVVKPQGGLPQINQNARDAFGSTPPRSAPVRPAINPLFNDYHGNTMP